ncbi:glycoside hydrolase 68 family protein [Cryobacterium sp. LW097]|uniref:glycoside hydrolase family 68 protein n=1 Tax=unclassified Cryobacterium TaxID=2649013 RepID=UPI000B4DC7B6|nr:MULTISPECIES: glycoside hydrolase family 68 protein [unclassified Cryobacterium]ASD24098.1 glycoside hydrolase 68 family protein [Cryobacterium sp. LW097]TFC60120.1 glycoside hydrolase family 68 protein [Cryobacterium sp. TMB1-7]TFC91502.1 glycoside hydrolase family 68 protein [Cryobacterium sp. TMT4-31]
MLIAGTLALGTLPAQAADFVPVNPGFPNPTPHSQQAYEPEADFTSRWTRADARQLKAMSDPSAPPRENSMPEEYTMPTIPQSFPDMSGGQVWVWDTWTLTNGQADQLSFKGWEVIFSLVADRNLGFDERHTYAKLGFFFRKADVPIEQRPENGGWTYGGLVFPDGASGAIYEDQSFSHQTEWSGSTRIFAGNKLRTFYTAVAFYRDAAGQDVKPADPRIVQTEGRIFADDTGVWLTGFRDQHQLLVPDGTLYQTKDQNSSVNFRDPFTFEDPAHPGKTFMVFEGNTAGDREAVECTAEDLGYDPADPQREVPVGQGVPGGPPEIASDANLRMGNVGLAVADNKALTQWHFLPPILSANCVTDQTERPQIYMKDGKYYIFTISHRSTFAPGIDGPEGVYGFVGNGVRSDFEPVNRGSGLALGSPSNLNYAAGFPFAPDFNQHPGQFQAYSHYVMPDGLVQSFIDTIGTSDDFRRGGTLAPTVRVDINGAEVLVDRSYGTDGLGAYADIPANEIADVPDTPDPRPIG